MRLTAQQQAVVNHDEGPALVFAVAGAGKTTAMVHRIERLVRTGVFAPQHILATSFGRANVQDLRQALAPWPHCEPVDIRTLHALGRSIIQQALQMGYCSHLQLNGNGHNTQSLLNQTLAEARRRNLPYKLELDGLDRADFLDYVSFCKGNLLYPNLKRVELPADARQTAGQAPPPADPLGWYLDLYQLFEEVRQQRGAVTFDDMLLTGWEILVTHADVQEQVQKRYQCLVVDEFQDINLAQSEILHLLAAPHSNYMTVGDDDQTIYEWRGANPRFILGFAQRYNADTYLISENFRCPAAPLALANGVIGHNQKREPKHLSLTRGFHGKTEVITTADVSTMSRRMVKHIQQLQEQGVALDDMAVLVRLNAQTPPIEQALIAAKVPYRVSQPFYERTEIKTLIHYGRFAWLERELQHGKRPLTNETTREKLGETWRDICNRPKRYISAPLREQLLRDFVAGSTARAMPFSQTITQFGNRVESWVAERLDTLADDIAWLSANLEEAADVVLTQLSERLDYVNFVRFSSGFPQTGDGRAASVESFLAYAQGKGSFLDFMKHVAQLAAANTGQHNDDGPAVTLSTIHQAKGLEWPVVLVAQCNEKIMPFNAMRTADVEEERRLFYVALTRTKRDLFLYVTETERPSRFLREANWQAALLAIQQVNTILVRDPATWQAAEALQLAQTVPALHLQRYFEAWWDVEEDVKTAVAQTMCRFFTAVARYNLHETLNIQPQWADWWRELGDGTAVASDDFPGLDALKPKRRQPKQKKTRANAIKRQQDAAESSPSSLPPKGDAAEWSNIHSSGLPGAANWINKRLGQKNDEEN
ncbi:MAG: ATP-dependent helicase [Chloroflexota bacterium]